MKSSNLHSVSGYVGKTIQTITREGRIITKFTVCHSMGKGNDSLFIDLVAFQGGEKNKVLPMDLVKAGSRVIVDYRQAPNNYNRAGKTYYNTENIVTGIRAYTDNDKSVNSHAVTGFIVGAKKVEGQKKAIDVIEYKDKDGNAASIFRFALRHPMGEGNDALFVDLKSFKADVAIAEGNAVLVKYSARPNNYVGTDGKKRYFTQNIVSSIEVIPTRDAEDAAEGDAPIDAEVIDAAEIVDTETGEVIEA